VKALSSKPSTVKKDVLYHFSHKGNKNYSEVPSHPNCNDYYIKITTKKKCWPGCGGKVILT
jgi:hypothetical protein